MLLLKGACASSKDDVTATNRSLELENLSTIDRCTEFSDLSFTSSLCLDHSTVLLDPPAESQPSDASSEQHSDGCSQPRAVTEQSEHVAVATRSQSTPRQSDVDSQPQGSREAALRSSEAAQSHTEPDSTIQTPPDSDSNISSDDAANAIIDTLATGASNKQDMESLTLRPSELNSNAIFIDEAQMFSPPGLQYVGSFTSPEEANNALQQITGQLPMSSADQPAVSDEKGGHFIDNEVRKATERMCIIQSNVGT